MARHASTYRQARRKAWKESPLTWEEFNTATKLTFKGKPDVLIGNIEHRHTPFVPKPNKYIPHTGAKQKAKAMKKGSTES